MSLSLGLIESLGFQQSAKLADLFADSGDALRNRFELQSKLPPLATEGFHLKAGVGNFSSQTRSFAIRAGKPLFGLRQLVTQTRDRRHCVEDGDARLFLLMLEFG